MVMRVWPARVKVEVLSIPAKPEGWKPGDPEEAVVNQETLDLVVTGLCADAVLRKVKDHFKRVAPNADIKVIGGVDWVSDKERDTIVVDF